MKSVVVNQSYFVWETIDPRMRNAYNLVILLVT